MIPSIYDNPERKGIDLELDFENGMAITIFMDDETVQGLINIMQNKLNARM